MIDSRYGTTENKKWVVYCLYVDCSIDNKLKFYQSNNRHTYRGFYIHDSKASGLPEKPGKGVH